jgi:hypothetical protein
MNVQVEPDIDTGNAGDETDIQSYAFIIWNWIYDRLALDPFFENFIVSRATSALPVEAWSQVPYLGVYMMEDPARTQVWNMTEVRFSHTIKVGMQWVLRNNDSKVLLRDLDRVKQFIARTLTRDDDLTNRFHTGLPGGTGINGFPEMRVRQPRWALAGSSKSETPVGEQVMELVMQYETTWYPYGFDDLERIDITTGFPGPGSTPEEREEILQARVVIIFKPDYVPPPYPEDTPAPGPPPGSP